MKVTEWANWKHLQYLWAEQHVAKPLDSEPGPTPTPAPAPKRERQRERDTCCQANEKTKWFYYNGFITQAKSKQAIRQRYKTAYPPWRAKERARGGRKRRGYSGREREMHFWIETRTRTRQSIKRNVVVII